MSFNQSNRSPALEASILNAAMVNACKLWFTLRPARPMSAVDQVEFRAWLHATLSLMRVAEVSWVLICDDSNNPISVVDSGNTAVFLEVRSNKCGPVWKFSHLA